MLVYGDRSRLIGTRERLATIAAALEAADRIASSADRSERGVRALVLAAELAQGIADDTFERVGEDAETAASRAALALIRSIAEACFGTGSLAAANGIVNTMTVADPPARVRIKTAEGYAFYAVYPRAYWLAARRARWAAPPLVIGVRSIGAGLAGVVAAAAGASLMVSVRPVGHPFHRELRLSTQLADQIVRHRGPVAIVDEGPGLSGSSFGAVADSLRKLGVAVERLVFFPSHAGEPGAMASPEHRGLWRSARREVVTLDDLLDEEPIGEWFADLIGTAHLTEDLSAGAWREVHPHGGRPPAWPSRERRKFRLTTNSGRYLARFAGLGESGEANFARARTLFGAGFVPEPIAHRRGFLLERWIEAAPARGGRTEFLRRLAGYIDFRSGALPAAPDQGAAPEQLSAMAIHNAGELGGPALADRVGRDIAELGCISDSRRPVQVDARLHGWEWRWAANGGWLKCDAVDHCADHDLVGCQNPLWDVAGAVIEHGLSAAETSELLAAVGERSQRRGLASLAIYQRLYAAFQGGYWSMAAQAQSGADAALCRARAERYQAALRRPMLAEG